MSNEKPVASEDKFQERLRDFAHEIRTPLNAMIGYSHLIDSELDRGGDAGKLREYNGIIETSTVRLLKICERVLDDAISGEKSVANMRVDMTLLTEDVVSTFRELASQRGIVLESDFPADFPELQTDPILVQQVLSNLVSNAVKFTPTGGSIKIKGEVSIENKAMIFIIRDTGKGIPADLILQIRNGKEVTTAHEEGEKGWGRGLRIATEICKTLDASLTIIPAETGGTVVFFSLPFAHGSGGG